MFLAIYLLADPVRAKGLVYAVVPRHHHVKLAKILLELKVIVGGYMRGQLITSVAIAVFVFVLLTACGVDDALALALFAGPHRHHPVRRRLRRERRRSIVAVAPHGAPARC